jgi:hypothetical protein
MKITIKLKVYPLIERAVEEGVGRGYLRAHKHTDTPDQETLKDHILQAVMNELCEIIDFGNE